MCYFFLERAWLSVCAFLSIWQNEWDLQDETSVLKSFPYLQNAVLTTLDTLVAIARCWRLQCAWAEVSSCAALIHSPCELGGCLVHAAQHQPLNPALGLWTFLWHPKFPQQTSLKPGESYGPLRRIRHELMLQVAVPTSFPHSSCEVPFAWDV